MSLTHWLVVGVLVLLLFGGRGKISDIMGDMAKGIKSFKKGLTEEEEAAAEAQPQRSQTIEHRADPQVRPGVGGNVDSRHS